MTRIFIALVILSASGQRAFASFDFSFCNHTIRQQLLRSGQSLLGLPRTVLVEG
jgi:hypothetical protein